MSQEMLPGGYWFRPVLIDELIPSARPTRPQDELDADFAGITETLPEGSRVQSPATPATLSA